MLAYNILIGEHDSQSEKGYCVRLFEKLRTCNKDGNRHIHVTEDDTYIEILINMAEPELTGMWVLMLLLGNQLYTRHFINQCHE